MSQCWLLCTGCSDKVKKNLETKEYVSQCWLLCTGCSDLVVACFAHLNIVSMLATLHWLFWRYKSWCFGGNSCLNAGYSARVVLIFPWTRIWYYRVSQCWLLCTGCSDFGKMPFKNLKASQCWLLCTGCSDKRVQVRQVWGHVSMLATLHWLFWLLKQKTPSKIWVSMLATLHWLFWWHVKVVLLLVKVSMLATLHWLFWY